MSSSPAVNVRYISECFIKPKHELEEHKKLINLTTWDLRMISLRYMQKGLLYPIPPSDVVTSLLGQLKESLSLTLVHFYPLAGQLHTQLSELDNGGHTSSIFIDPSKGPGAKFIHAAIDLNIADLISPIDVPLVVHSLFDPPRAVNHDGHFLPLLTIQVTQLLDGIFIGCSMNHVCADGTSYWHFFNSWSEIFMKLFNKDVSINLDEPLLLVPDISRPPIHTRWSLDGSSSMPIIKLPFTHPDEFIRRFNLHPSQLTHRILHFSSESIGKIKAKANTSATTRGTMGNCCNTISSLQALSALVWRCVTRARRVPLDEEVRCRILINNRGRLDPPLSDYYFGNCIEAVCGRNKAGKLIQESLGCAALILNKAVSAHNDKAVRDTVEDWIRTPFIAVDKENVVSGGVVVAVVGSPWFNVYGNEFGMLGKPVAVLSGDGSKSDGKVIFGPGREGGGSVDLDICLPPEIMRALETDDEFMGALV